MVAHSVLRSKSSHAGAVSINGVSGNAVNLDSESRRYQNIKLFTFTNRVPQHYKSIFQAELYVYLCNRIHFDGIRLGAG